MSKICLLTAQSVCPLPRMLAIIGTAEASSEHPIGVAVVEYVKKVLSTTSFGQCKDFKAQSGYGIRCKVSGIDHMFEKYDGESFENRLNRLNASININDVEVSQSRFIGDGK